MYLSCIYSKLTHGLRKGFPYKKLTQPYARAGFAYALLRYDNTLIKHEDGGLSNGSGESQSLKGSSRAKLLVTTASLLVTGALLLCKKLLVAKEQATSSDAMWRLVRETSHEGRCDQHICCAAKTVLKLITGYPVSNLPGPSVPDL